MTYQPYPIANFSTGFDKSRQPWLIPDDAQDTLYDGFVYRGVWSKRPGYSQFAYGGFGGAPICESRMVYITTDELVAHANGSTKVYTYTLANIPVRRGTVTISYTISGTPHTAVDNGLGTFSGFDVTTVSSTINYTTGAIQLTFSTAPDNSTDIKATYDTHQGLPVMGVMNFYTAGNLRQLIVADEMYINRYNPTTNRLDDITTTPLTGSYANANFMSWTSYPDPQANPRLLFTNNNDPIQQYNGTSVTPYPIYTESTQITNVASGVLGDGTIGPYTINTPTMTGIVPNTLTIVAAGSPDQTVTDDQFGNLKGDGTGTVDYMSGVIVVTFNATVAPAAAINITYKQLNTPITTALHVRNFQDRLVVLAPIIGTILGRRILVSGFGAFGDVFTQDAVGAGVIDMPDQSYIVSCDFNRDDLVIFTSTSSWLMKYTNNDSVPFVLNQIDNSRGSSTPYGTITYQNITKSQSQRGFIATDGYSIKRTDDKIPQFSFNEIEQSEYNKCQAGSVDEDRDHYLIYPPTGEITFPPANRILISNYEEFNYSIYRIPLSTMGEFQTAVAVTWADLSIYDTWYDMASIYGNWNAFAYAQGSPIAIGGGFYGEIVELNDVATEDYPVLIRNVTIVDQNTLQVTTDFQNWQIGDEIVLAAMSGMFEGNQKQGQIISVTNHYTFNLDLTTTNNFSPYTGSGRASKVITFQSKTKQFNPFAGQDKKVRCGWVYFYVSNSGCDLTTNTAIAAITKASICKVTAYGHGYTTGQQISIFGVAGMTQVNGFNFYITVVDADNFILDGVDSTSYGTYISGGVSTIPDNAYLDVFVYTNDNTGGTLLTNYNPPIPYRINLSDTVAEQGIKKWYKLWINQVGRFIQFEFFNNQSGADIFVHAIMPGFAGVGRLI